MRMCAVYGHEIPAVGIQYLPDLTPCFLIITAVDDAYVHIIQLDEANIRGAFDIIIVIGYLYQLIHVLT